ncbi:MAG: HDOD domain-containing protein [Spirochaetes bacterium]|nr:HDOD domain-containing protein [Spirochaetota bacterium]
MTGFNKELIFDSIDHNKETIIETTLKDYLTLIKKPNLFQHLSYILKEMVGNANKANLKRVHFILNELNINIDSDYKQGMETFREYLTLYNTRYFEHLKKRGFYVKVTLTVSEENLVIIVQNNSKMLPIEKNRIDEKIKKSIRFTSMEEALTQGLDQTEGAGFGLILSLMLLRKIGLDERMFKIFEKENVTEVRLIVPLSLLDKEQEEFIAESIKNEIRVIPQFPQHIMELQSKLSNPNANFKDLSSIINKDPSLIADILKVANSSIYMMPHRVKTIEEAVRQIGFKGVKNLVFTYSVQKLLLEKYNTNIIKEIMEHSSEVAFYAYEIAKYFKLNNIIDETYTAAILHDFGKIIINSLNPYLIKKIENLCHEKEININLVENLTNGFNHSLIGSSLAIKWKFSENIIETIKYHHLPLDCKEEFKDLVYVVYLSNELYYYKRNEVQFDNINYNVLKYFKIEEKNNFDIIIMKMYNLLEKIKNEKLN